MNGYIVSSLVIGSAAMIVGAIGFVWDTFAVLSAEIHHAKQMQSVAAILAIAAFALYQKGRKAPK